MKFILHEWEPHPPKSRVEITLDNPPDATYEMDFKDQEAANKYIKNQGLFGGCYWHAIPAHLLTNT